MPSLKDVVLHPDRRRAEVPAERVDLRQPIWLGIAAWTVALVVAVVLEATSTVTGGRFVAIACAGLALGGVGLWWEHRNRTRYHG
ncbi:DUF2530 domain-containing protein [Luteimicrobium album]|uniref:DUF2530 domain-containing protein n=1 Tax=Luteimicrobium album TaxID=1054550 RepID=UPI0024E1331B|nr:DUF2530 domain-containing protein [Luteimicrobium album]